MTDATHEIAMPSIAMLGIAISCVASVMR